MKRLSDEKRSEIERLLRSGGKTNTVANQTGCGWITVKNIKNQMEARGAGSAPVGTALARRPVDPLASVTLVRDEADRASVQTRAKKGGALPNSAEISAWNKHAREKNGGAGLPAVVEDLRTRRDALTAAIAALGGE